MTADPMDRSVVLQRMMKCPTLGLGACGAGWKAGSRLWSWFASKFQSLMSNNGLLGNMLQDSPRVLS